MSVDSPGSEDPGDATMASSDSDAPDSDGADSDEPDAHAADPEARAYAAFDRGDLIAARAAFETLVRDDAQRPALHYMLGLACKYLRDWPASLRHNLQALALQDEADEASQWNAGIAATALGDWPEARRQWAACGIALDDDDGPIAGNFGVSSIRLNPWDDGETLFARRIDPVRAQLINVPLPQSGYRFGDIVLHDGAATGQRRFHQSVVPVFNALERVQASEFRTFAVFVECPAEDDIAQLSQTRLPGVAQIEDWTDTIVHICLRCSHGTPHRHDAEDRGAWTRERNLGIAAQSRHSVQKLIERWIARGRGRRLQGIDGSEAALRMPPGNGSAWWLDPEDRAEISE